MKLPGSRPNDAVAINGGPSELRLLLAFANRDDANKTKKPVCFSVEMPLDFGNCTPAGGVHVHVDLLAHGQTPHAWGFSGEGHPSRVCGEPPRGKPYRRVIGYYDSETSDGWIAIEPGSSVVNPRELHEATEAGGQ